MKRRRATILWLVAVTVVFIGANNALAGWKEEQADLFKQVSVKPGDTIDSTNWERVKDILPLSIVDWVKRGDFILNIGEIKWDYNTDPVWQELSVQNEGKYDIGPNGEIIEKATGESPIYVDGKPFPNIDWKNDPKAGVKLAYNHVLKNSRAGTYEQESSVEWVSRQGPTRSLRTLVYWFNFWARPAGQISNPGKHLILELDKVVEPYDVAGSATLVQRTIDSKADQLYSYVPAIRRVKKVSGAVRSSPFFGTDLVNDDGNGFAGKVESMDWRVVGQQITLLPVPKWAVEGPAKCVKQPNGSWAIPKDVKEPTLGYDVPDWKGAPWCPVDMVYIPRMMYVLESKAKDKYYNYGDMTYYVDPVAGYSYKVINDRTGSYWKTMLLPWAPAEWDNKVTFSSTALMLMVDSKTDHATVSHCFGSWKDKFHNSLYNAPVDVTMMAPTAIATHSK